MTEPNHGGGTRQLVRVPTGIAGFDAITGGGLPVRRTCLITGTPGTGKTTFGNQLAFAHAASGGQVIVATLLTESHDVLLENLAAFAFFDADQVGDRIRYLSVLTPLMASGLDATIDTLRQEVRKANATLLVIDGTAIDDDLDLPAFDLKRFAHRLESQSSFLGCTTVLLTATSENRVHPLWARVNSVVLLTNRPVGSQHVRGLEVVKMRGAHSVSGVHEFAITEAGITVFPRLEALAGRSRLAQSAEHGLGTGVSGLDAMLGGGLMPRSSTLVMGTPGSGKTILGLHFLMEGAKRGEPGLLAGFHETADDLATTAERIGLDLRRHLDSGLIRVLWNAPLELSADDWAWKLLQAVEEHAPSRVYIDALTDVQRVMTAVERMPLFVPALVNELRNRGTTVLIAAEIDEYTDDTLTIPLPAASAAMDNCILLRHVEIRGEWRRVVGVPKARQSVADPSIRDVQITERGMTIAHPILAATGLLTGRATPVSEPNGDDTP
jgi:circadian clock protein KaiC